MLQIPSIRPTRSRLARLLLVLLLVAASLLALPATRSGAPAYAAEPIDGSDPGCADFILEILFIDIDIPDPGWIWIDSVDPFRSVSGVATKSEVTHTDFPAVHDSHDLNVDIIVDPGYEDLLAVANANDPTDPRPVDKLEIEWEIGTYPSETGKSVPERTLPKWVWPNVGDRVWANGHWIFDCGHPTEIDGVDQYRSEIHPPRAIASMRDQFQTLPGTGTTPVRVTATDLYIHGGAGFVTDILYCGAELIVSSDPNSCPTKMTPIAADYEFDIELPPKPVESAVLSTFIQDGPGNTVDVAPILEPMPADNPTRVHVTVPLDGSGAAPSDVYARQISAGWVYPPEEMRHLKLTLNKMDLHEDMDLDPGDCECTFFWMNVDKADQREWIRLADFAQGNMNDYDDDGGLGDGEMDFSGATFDFFVGEGEPFNVRAHGYDQDCLDDYFGDHSFDVDVFVDCYFLGALTFDATGDNDDYNVLSASFGAPNYGVGSQDVTAGGQYELEFTIEEIPLTVEDSADLALTKICKPDDTVRAGELVTCTILVDNPGPGLPRDVVVRDTLFTNVDPADYTMGTPTFTFSGIGTSSTSECDVTAPNRFTCELGTVPVGGRAEITATFSSDEPGDFNNEAIVSTSSTDPDLSNNQDIDGVTVTPVADLSVTKTDGTDPIAAGTNLTYTLDVTNDGPSTAENVVLHDVLPAGVSIVSVTPAVGSCNAGVPGDADLPTTCALGTLASGQSAVVTIEVTVLPDTLGLIHNDATVSSDAFDPNNGDNHAVESTSVFAQVDLAVAKTGTPDPVVAGTNLTYRVEVSNNGPSLARNVRLVDGLPAGTAFASYAITAGAGSCAPSVVPPHQVECALADLGPGASAVVFIDVGVDPALLAASIDNMASATSAGTESNPADNAVTITTEVVTEADLVMAVGSDADIYKPSSVVIYTLTATNTGPSVARDVVVVQDLPDKKGTEYLFDDGACVYDDTGPTLTCAIGDLDPGASASIAVHEWVKGGAKGTVTTTATATSSTTDPNPSNNSMSWTILVKGGKGPQ